MRGGVRLFLGYLVFALISAGLHSGAIWGFRKKTEESNAKVMPSPTLAVQTVSPPAAEPTPPPRYRETREEKVKEAPIPEPVPDPVSETTIPEPVSKPVQPETKPEPEPEPDPDPEPEREMEPESRPEPTAEIGSVQEYRAFLAKEMPPPGGKDPYIPKIHFGSNSAQENLEIMKYFGMEVIAYPPGQDYYIYIEPRQNLFRRNTDIEYLENYSNRVIFRSSSWFRSLKEEAAREVGVDAGQLAIAQLLPPSTANYLAWKQKRASEVAGVSLEDVDGCDARFVRAGIGVWIIRIERLRLRDGRVFSVKDPEWEKVSGGGR